MKIRVVQIWGFLMTVLGWIFVACTMAMEGWKIAAVGGMAGSSLLKVAWYWSSLWRSCFTDSTAVSNCYDFPVLWSVEGHVQIVRGLLMAALTTGMLGFVLSLIGMECTFLGGKDLSKHKKIYAGGLCHIISGFLSSCGYVVYAQFVSVDYFNPDFDGLKFDLGTPLFLGWVGSAFHMAGGFFYLWVITIRPEPDPEQNNSTAAVPTVSEITSKTKVSSVTELSSGSAPSDISAISSRSERTSKSGRAARSGQSTRTGRTSRSAGSESRSGAGSEADFSMRSSLPTLSESRSSSSGSSSRSSSSRSSSKVSSLSGRSRTTVAAFMKNSYI